MNVCRLAMMFALTVCLTTVVRAQTTEDEIRNRLVKKPLYLRGFWRDDQLQFDDAGKLSSKSGRLSFALAGVDVKKVRLEDKHLILQCKRVGVEFKGKAPKREVLLVGDRPPYNEESLNITIDAPPDGDFSKPLDAIFANGLLELVRDLPPSGSALLTPAFFLSRHHHLRRGHHR